MPRVSVVIAAQGSPRLLARCLEALRCQDLPPASYEVLVVDDRGDLAARAVAEAASAGRRVRWLAGPGRGPAAARNLGWRAAAEDVVAFTGEDCVPARDWLSRGLAALSRGAEAAHGRTLVPRPQVPTDYERCLGWLQGASCAATNLFCRRAALAAAGGFDERFGAAWREGSDLRFTLLERGVRVGWALDAIVVHPIATAPWGGVLALQSGNQSEALLFAKHRRLYRRRGGRTPWFYYGVVACLAAAGLGAAGLAEAVERPALGVWSLLTAAFFLKRQRGARLSFAHLLEVAVTSALIPPLAVYHRLRGAVRYRVVFL